jgi:tetrahydromethanopterin S-methyltransferase subunit C
VSYFFILPAFIVFETALLLVAVVSHYREKLRWVSGYLIGVFLGSTVGFVLLNLILWIIPAMSAFTALYNSLPEFAQSIVKFIMAIGLLFGPFFASAGGLFIGALIGIYFVYRRRNNYKTLVSKKN